MVFRCLCYSLLHWHMNGLQRSHSSLVLKLTPTSRRSKERLGSPRFSAGSTAAATWTPASTAAALGRNSAASIVNKKQTRSTAADGWASSGGGGVSPTHRVEEVLRDELGAGGSHTWHTPTEPQTDTHTVITEVTWSQDMEAIHMCIVLTWLNNRISWTMLPSEQRTDSIVHFHVMWMHSRPLPNTHTN